MKQAQKFVDKQKSDQNIQTDSSSSFEEGDDVSGQFFFYSTLFTRLIDQ